MHLAAYNFSSLTKDLNGIFNHEDITKTISIGHGWSSLVAQRVCLHAPACVAGLNMLNVACNTPLDQPFVLDGLNDLAAQVYGYFLTFDEGTRLMSENPERLWDILQSANANGNWTKKMFTEEDALRYQIFDSSPIPLKEYAKNEKLKGQIVDRITRDGFETWQAYYLARKDNVQFEAEKVGVRRDRSRVDLPVLYVGCSCYLVAGPESINAAKLAGLLPDLEEVLVESGHWCMFEKPEEVNKTIRGFLENRFWASVVTVRVQCLGFPITIEWLD